MCESKKCNETVKTHILTEIRDVTVKTHPNLKYGMWQRRHTLNEPSAI